VSGYLFCRETFPSGCLTLDLALGGGFPKGRIVEVCCFHLCLLLERRSVYVVHCAHVLCFPLFLLFWLFYCFDRYLVLKAVAKRH
jgi:hypothetical protein